MDKTEAKSESRHHGVRYSIDGRPFKGPRKQVAKKLLRQAGLDPEGYNLAKLSCNRDEPHQFADDDIVCIDPGDRFVSVRERATVA